MKWLIVQLRKPMVENCKLYVATRLRRDFGRQVATNLKEFGYGG